MATVATTGSQYNGETKLGKMDGYGEYTFINGTRYQGNFKNGMFHGEGKLIFPNRGVFKADWVEGRAVTDETGIGGHYIFQDGLEYGEMDWSYCHHKDRRFYTEVCNGLKPAGCTQARNSDEESMIPLGWYDTGDGYYNPENHVIYTYKDNQFLRNADLEEHEWIITTCRKGVEPHHQLGSNGLFH